MTAYVAAVCACGRRYLRPDAYTWASCERCRKRGRRRYAPGTRCNRPNFNGTSKSDLGHVQGAETALADNISKSTISS